jgi:predicted TIM-barrel fold metal-dependent hydrolase
MIIDAHVYCLPERLRDHKVRLPVEEKNIVITIYKHPEGEAALKLSSPGNILLSMDKSGIDKSVLVSLPWKGQDLCRENNDFVLEQARCNQRFMAICSVQPRARDWKGEAVRCLSKGAIAIKVNPVWQGGSLDSHEINELADFIAKKRAFLMVHVDHAFRKSNASAAHLFNLAKTNPKTRILAAHLGGMLGLYNLHQPIAEALKNVWFDTAVSSTVKMVEFNIKSGLENKIIFGSDFPFNHNHEQIQVLRSTRSLKLGRSVKNKILSENLLSLIKSTSP